MPFPQPLPIRPNPPLPSAPPPAPPLPGIDRPDAGPTRLDWFGDDDED
jgi:hypothetical protein